MQVVVGLGSNLGDRLATLLAALRSLDDIATLVRVSSLYETDPVGPAEFEFLNAAVLARYEGSPLELLDALLAIERLAGRERRERWGPRTLDLDVLFIEGLEVKEPGLAVPHRHLLERGFALLPLLDVLPGAVHPVSGQPLAGFRARVSSSGVRRAAGPEWAEPLGKAGFRPPP